MATRWRTVRIFISSTFRDMHAERDQLVKVVFPALRASLLAEKIHLEDIDLRWGVTVEQADNDLALDLCLEQIDECRPFFVGILGERYGFVPVKFPVHTLSKSKFGWVQHCTGKSITELEILYGVLNDQKMHDRSFFYFRDPAFVPELDEEHQRVFEEGPTDAELATLPPDQAEALAQERRQKLVALKTCIAQTPSLPVYADYPCDWDDDAYDRPTQSRGRLVGLEAFGERVREQLEQAICNAPELAEHFASLSEEVDDPDGLIEEADYHEQFIESRTRIYVGRQGILHQLTAFADGDATVPALVTGPSGSGKSAVLAMFADTYREQHPDTLLIPHFIGASPTSTSLRQALQRLCTILKNEFGYDDDVPPDLNKLATTFRKFLEEVPAGRRVVLAIDALNQFDETDRAQEMWWLPTALPAHVKVIVSCIDDPDRIEPALEAFGHRPHELFTVDLLTDEERVGIIRQIPSLSAKTLDETQVQLLVANPATRIPLFLLVALEELRGFGSFEQLNARIAAFPAAGDTVTAVFAQVIERLEEDFGEEITHAVLSLLASARRGLSEREFSALVKDVSRAENLFPVLRQIRPYLQHRGPLLDFFHRNLYKAARQRYLTTPETQQAAHSWLAEHFAAQPNHTGNPPNRQPNERKADELPWQYAQASRRGELEQLLTEFDFLQAKVNAFGPQPLIEDYDLLDVDRNDPLGLIQGAIMLGANTLVRDPAQLAGQLHGRLLGTEETEVQRLLAKAVPSRECWLRPVYTCLTPPGGPLIRRLEGHTAEVNSVALHADGRRAVSASYDKTLKVWDLETGVCLRTLEGHRDRLKSVALHADGRRAVSASDDRTLKVWDLSSGACLRTLEGHKGGVGFVALHADGRRAVSVSDDKTLKVWVLETGTCLCTLEGHTRGVASVALHADGRRAVSASWDSSLKVWDLETGACLYTLEGHTDDVESVEIHADGKRVFSASSDKTLKSWDLETGTCLRTFTGHTEAVNSVALHVDGHRAVSASSDNTLKVWDLESGACLRSLQAHANNLRALALDANGHRAVSASSDNTLKVWDLGIDVRLRTLEGHAGRIYAVAADADGRLALSASEDKTLKVWNLRTGACLHTLEGHRFNALVAVCADGRRAVSASRSSLKVWDLETGACLCTHDVHTGSLRSMVLHPDGRRAVLVRMFEPPTVWDLETGACLRVLDGHLNWVKRLWRSALGQKTLKGHIGRVNCVALHADGRRAVSAGDLGDHTLKVWNLKTGACLHTLERHRGGFHSVVLHPDGQRAVSASWSDLKVWDLETGTCLHTIKGCAKEEDGGIVTPVALDADGRRAVAGLYDNTLKVWDLETGTCLHTLEGHMAKPSFVAFHTDSRRAVSASEDKTLKVWDLETGQELSSFTTEANKLCCAIAPNGDTVVAGDRGGHVYFLRMEDGTSKM
jgi:WD40 repeat protein